MGRVARFTVPGITYHVYNIGTRHRPIPGWEKKWGVSLTSVCCKVMEKWIGEEPTEGVSTRGHELKLQKRACRTSVRTNILGLRIVNL